MEERTFQIQLSDECLALQDIDMNAFAEQIRKELLDNEKVLEEMVSPLCNGIREEFSNDSIAIYEELVELTSPIAGTVQIDFDGYVHMGCKDMSGPVNHSDTVRFTIDDSGMLSLHMTYPDEREPDTY